MINQENPLNNQVNLLNKVIESNFYSVIIDNKIEFKIIHTYSEKKGFNITEFNVIEMNIRSYPPPGDIRIEKRINFDEDHEKALLNFNFFVNEPSTINVGSIEELLLNYNSPFRFHNINRELLNTFYGGLRIFVK